MRSAFLVLALPVFALAQAPGQPRLLLEAPHFDFGQLPPDSVATHRFKLANAGSAPLHITRLLPACGCTSALSGKDTLEPGESTEVEISFRTAGLSGRTRKSVEVDCDDPAAAQAFLSFEAEVMRAVTASTEAVQFLDLTRKDRRKASVKLTSATGKPIEVKDVKLSPASWLGVATRPDGNDQWVDLDLLARNLPANRLAGTDTITLELGNPWDSTVHLLVNWDLRAPVVASPARIAWAAPAGQELQSTVTLKAREPRPFRILAARTSTPLLRVLGLPRGAAVRQVIQVALSAEASPGTYDEKVFLTLDTPGHPEFPVRVAASLTGPPQ